MYGLDANKDQPPATPARCESLEQTIVKIWAGFFDYFVEEMDISLITL